MKKKAPQTCPKSFLNSPWFLLTAILLATIILYARMLHFSLLSWDDNKNILENPDILKLGWTGVKKIFSSAYLGMYQPLTTLSFALEYKLAGFKPVIYHFTNLLLHLVNTILVFRFIYLISKKVLPAAFVAFLFALHPLHIESVAWVSERKDVLYSFFFLLSLISWVNYIRYGYKKSHYFIALLFFACSLLSKSAAVTLPLLLFLIDYKMNRKIKLKTLPDKIPFLLLSLGFGILSLFTQEVITQGTVIHFSIIQKIFVGAYALGWYLLMAIFPFHLSALHPLPVIKNGLLPLHYYFSVLIFILVIWLILKMYFAKKLSSELRRELFFGAGFFLIPVSLILFIPVGHAVVAERYTYLPYLGIFYLLYVFFGWLKEKKSFMAKWILAFFVVLSCYYVATTYTRLGIWENSMTLFNDMIKKYPDRVAVAWNNRGLEKNAKADFEGALKDYTQSIAIDPGYAEAYSNRGLILKDAQRFSEAIADFNNAVTLNPKLFEAFYNRGLVYNNLKQYGQAIDDFNKAIALKPDLAVAFADRGISFALTGNLYAAINDFTTAIQIKPDFGRAYSNRARAKLDMKDLSGACSDWKKAADLGFQQATQMLATYCN